MRSAIDAARPTWNRERLRQSVATLYGDDSVVVLANREPYRHDYAPDGSIVVRQSASGVVTALEPVLHACSGVWVAHGAGTADRSAVDRWDGLEVPPANSASARGNLSELWRDRPQYRLRRVWLEDHEERGFYYGFANEGLWPLCHRVHVQPKFRSNDFEMYEAVNRRFAEAVCEEVEGERPLVLVQDYHFALAPRMIRERLPLSTIVTFWHVPWPAPRDYAVCPWGPALIEGLLGSDIIGFQTPGDCRAFIDTCASSVSAQIDRARHVVTATPSTSLRARRRTLVRAYPVSVACPNLACRLPSVEACRTEVLRKLGLPADVRLGVGVDRLDYTKGIEEKFLAIERLLESHPEFHERFVFVQIAEPSRTCLRPYRELRSRLVAATDRINNRFGTSGYRPLIVLETHHDPPDVYKFLRAADLCYVGSLHDGMNLVAKEFVSARDDERGVLVLSQFTGAARELTAAVIVNPYAIDRAADALAKGLAMSDGEQSCRMRAMRATVMEWNVNRWAGQMLEDAARVRGNSARPHLTPSWRVDLRRASATPFAGR